MGEKKTAWRENAALHLIYGLNCILSQENPGRFFSNKLFWSAQSERMLPLLCFSRLFSTVNHSHLLYITFLFLLGWDAFRIYHNASTLKLPAWNLLTPRYRCAEGSNVSAKHSSTYNPSRIHPEFFSTSRWTRSRRHQVKRANDGRTLPRKE